MEDTVGIKDTHEKQTEDTLEARINDLHEKQTEDEARIKDSDEKQTEDTIDVRKNDLIEKQTENAIEISISDLLEIEKKKAIKDRIRVLLESQIKDPLEESMKNYQNIDGFCEAIAKIPFQFSGEELFNKLHDEYRDTLSIIHIADVKKENFSFLNMKIFCLCLDNLVEFDYVDDEIIVSEIEILLRKVFLFALKDIESEADFKAHSVETIKCTRFLFMFLQNYERYIIDLEEKLDFLQKIQFCIKHIMLIIEDSSELKNHFLKFNFWEKCFLGNLEAIKKCDDFQRMNLFYSASAILDKYLKKIFIDTEFKEAITQVLTLIQKPIVLNQPLELALKLDNKYMKFLVQAIKENRDTRDFKDIKKSIINDCKSLIEQWEENYRKTPSKTLPNINELLCLGLYNFVKVSLGNGFKNAFRFYFTSNGEQGDFTFYSLINLIDALPSQVQYFIGEILVRLRKNEAYWFKFIIEKNQKKIGFLKISQEWAADYVELACSPPYSLILNKFKQDENLNLRNLLEEITPEIILMDLPEKVYGRFLYNGSIILKLFMDPDGSKGATFVNYLHELGHFLQRSICETIEASESPKSLRRFEVNEGGYLIENEIFGTCLYYITEEAADYIVSRQVDQDHEQFKKVFNEKNTLKQDKKAISLHRSSNVVLLGQCGSRFRSASQKPKKKPSDEKALLEDQKKDN